MQLMWERWRGILMSSWSNRRKMVTLFPPPPEICVQVGNTSLDGKFRYFFTLRIQNKISWPNTLVVIAEIWSNLQIQEADGSAPQAGFILVVIWTFCSIRSSVSPEMVGCGPWPLHWPQNQLFGFSGLFCVITGISFLLHCSCLECVYAEYGRETEGGVCTAVESCSVRVSWTDFLINEHNNNWICTK